MLQNGRLTDFAERFDKMYVKLSVELNMIEINRFFFTEKRGVIRLSWPYKSDPTRSEHVKKVGQSWGSSLPHSSTP